jgi:predicted AAA+ superfamily ATPase
MFIERKLRDQILATNATFPVLVLTGPRQVGKTTLLESIAEPNRTIVSLDDPNERFLAKTEPQLFIERYKPPVLIDEIQYAPELLPYIKIYVDKFRREGDFWLTGSQMFRLMQDVSESLAGRAGILRMFSLSNEEISGRNLPTISFEKDALLSRRELTKQETVVQIFDKIFKGGMPRLYENSNVSRTRYFESYLDTYLSRDIRQLAQVANEQQFLRFLQVVAARTATNINYDTLAQETGISAPTAKKWLSLLVTSGIVVLLQPYFSNTLKRIIKAPRLYFMDTGLCAHLLRIPSAASLEASSFDGPFFETWVISELYKNYINSGVEPPLFFYRDQNKREIDCIVAEFNTLHPLEIKKASAPRGATRHFSALKPLTETAGDVGSAKAVSASNTKRREPSIGLGGVVCLSPDLLPADDQNWFIPAWMI